VLQLFLKRCAIAIERMCNKLVRQP